MMPVAMGSCKMFMGEGKDYVGAQIKRMAAIHPSQYFFDIICLPDQIEEAIEILAFFYAGVKAELPWLNPAHIFTAITHDGAVRPAAMTLAFLNQDSQIAAMDIHPERDAGK